MPELDLHGLEPSRAMRLLAQELHACRVRRAPGLVVITGRGWGNKSRTPVLRTRVEQWLDGPEGRGLGVQAWRRVHREGALEIELGPAR